MHVEIREYQGITECRVTIQDHLGFELALECMRQLRALDSRRIQRLIFDLTNTPSLESSGVGMLMHTRERWPLDKESMEIHCRYGKVHDILNICRMQLHYQIKLSHLNCAREAVPA